MPPRRLKRRAVERLVKNRVAEAIAEYERNRTNPENVRGSSLANTGGVNAPKVLGFVGSRKQSRCLKSASVLRRTRLRLLLASRRVCTDMVEWKCPHCDDLINQVNLKSMEISDLNASLQEKVLEITALKDDLRKLKGKTLVDNAVMKHTIDPEMLKIDVELITSKLLNKKTAHSAYIKHTQEEATVLRDLVEHVKSKYPLDHSLESACRHAKLIQELITHISKTCSSVNNTDGKLVVVTPKNKDERVRFTKPVTSLGYTIT
ncbi:hypothetical protein Tco_1053433, partial [Tanacetum coccineum]